MCKTPCNVENCKDGDRSCLECVNANLPLHEGDCAICSGLVGVGPFICKFVRKEA